MSSRRMTSQCVCHGIDHANTLAHLGFERIELINLREKSRCHIQIRVFACKSYLTSAAKLYLHFLANTALTRQDAGTIRRLGKIIMGKSCVIVHAHTNSSWKQLHDTDTPVTITRPANTAARMDHMAMYAFGIKWMVALVLTEPYP